MNTQASRDRVTATFRIVGDTLDPKQWTGYFDVAPTLAVHKGTPRPPRSVYPVGLWMLQSAIHSDDIDAHIEHLISSLTLVSHPALPNDMQVAQVKADMFCYIDNHANDLVTTVRSGLTRFLAAYGIAVNIDLYPQDMLFCDNHGCWTVKV